jgi:hypothetical protein
VEAVDAAPLQCPLVAPVDLGLVTGEHLEAPVQVGPRGVDPGAGLLEVKLDALVAPGEAVVLDEALVDHGAREARLFLEPRVDERGEGLDHLGRVGAPRQRRRRRWRVLGQILLHGAPVAAGLAGDVRETRATLTQVLKRSDVHPGLLM